MNRSKKGENVNRLTGKPITGKHINSIGKRKASKKGNRYTGKHANEAHRYIFK